MAQRAWRKAPLRLREWLSAPVRRRLQCCSAVRTGNGPCLIQYMRCRLYQVRVLSLRGGEKAEGGRESFAP